MRQRSRLPDENVHVLAMGAVSWLKSESGVGKPVTAP